MINLILQILGNICCISADITGKVADHTCVKECLETLTNTWLNHLALQMNDTLEHELELLDSMLDLV